MLAHNRRRNHPPRPIRSSVIQPKLNTYTTVLQLPYNHFPSILQPSPICRVPPDPLNRPQIRRIATHKTTPRHSTASRLPFARRSARRPSATSIHTQPSFNRHTTTSQSAFHPLHTVHAMESLASHSRHSVVGTGHITQQCLPLDPIYRVSQSRKCTNTHHNIHLQPQPILNRHTTLYQPSPKPPWKLAQLLVRAVCHKLKLMTRHVFLAPQILPFGAYMH